jgi:hypothetical protein
MPAAKLGAGAADGFSMINTGVLQRDHLTQIPRLAAVAVGGALAVILGLLAGFGWLYLLRGAGWLAAGPSVGDSLPLLQLAGFDGQPLLRLVVAWLLAGGLTGVALSDLRRPPRVALSGILGLLLLLIACQVAYALARNLRLTDILFTRPPGPGPWLEALCFAVACLLPRRSVFRGRGPASGNLFGRRVAPGNFGLSGGKIRHAAQHDRDRQQVPGDSGRVGA